MLVIKPPLSMLSKKKLLFFTQASTVMKQYICKILLMPWTKHGQAFMMVTYPHGIYLAVADMASAFGVVQIDEKDAKRLPNQTEKIPGSPGKYVVEIDVFHQLHCLVREAFVKILMCGR
jgi:Mycotoxin biosynthesis protein UstYa